MIQSPKPRPENPLSASPRPMSSPPRAPANSPIQGAPRAPTQSFGELPDYVMATPPSSGIASPVTSPLSPERNEQDQIRQAYQQTPQLFGLGLFAHQTEAPQQGPQNTANPFLFGVAQPAIHFDPAVQPGLATQAAWRPLALERPSGVVTGGGYLPMRTSSLFASVPPAPRLEQGFFEAQSHFELPAPPRPNPNEATEAEQPDRKRQRRD